MNSGEISDHQLNFMNAIGGSAPPHVIEYLLEVASLNKIQINKTHINFGITPLMCCTARIDDDDTLQVAEILLEHGARVDERDTSGPGVTALLMAAQEGKARLLQLLIDRGGTIDICGRKSPTQPLYLAAQNGHEKCVALLIQAARDQGKDMQAFVDARNRSGCTSSNQAVARASAVIVGVLAKAGADLRLACPYEYCITGRQDGSIEMDPQSNKREVYIDPDPVAYPTHHSLITAVRSFVTCACAHCGETHEIKTCTRCHMTCYCSPNHQKADWKSHKLVCKKLRRGQDMIFEGKQLPVPEKEPFGFLEKFGELDNETRTWEEYDRDNHPVWEYDAGQRGYPKWERYPPRIEEGLESMIDTGGPRLMYRPNNPDADGKYEGGTKSERPPSFAATRYVYYCDMIEREIYTGAARAVRRNGKPDSGRKHTDPFADPSTYRTAPPLQLNEETKQSMDDLIASFRR